TSGSPSHARSVGGGGMTWPVLLALEMAFLTPSNRPDATPVPAHMAGLDQRQRPRSSASVAARLPVGLWGYFSAMLRAKRASSGFWAGAILATPASRRDHIFCAAFSFLIA